MIPLSPLHLGRLKLLFPGHQQRPASEVEQQPGHLWVFMWDTLVYLGVCHSWQSVFECSLKLLRSPDSEITHQMTGHVFCLLQVLDRGDLRGTDTEMEEHCFHIGAQYPMADFLNFSAVKKPLG